MMFFRTGACAEGVAWAFMDLDDGALARCGRSATVTALLEDKMTRVFTKVMSYLAADGTLCEGYLAGPAESGLKRPGILIAPDWFGVGDFVRTRAEALAKLGYVVLVADVYGKGIRPATAQEAAGMTRAFREDRAALRMRVRAGYDALRALPQVDEQYLVATGYCFGGTTVLELARSGAELSGVVSFHGGLSNPNPRDVANIRGKVLVMHGAADPFVPQAEVTTFRNEMQEAGIDLRFIAYPGAVHAFTSPLAGSDPSTGLAYDALADAASWREFSQFLAEVAPLPTGG